MALSTFLTFIKLSGSKIGNALSCHFILKRRPVIKTLGRASLRRVPIQSSRPCALVPLWGLMNWGRLPGRGSKTVIPSRAFAKIADSWRAKIRMGFKTCCQTLSSAARWSYNSSRHLCRRLSGKSTHKSPHGSAASRRLRSAFAAVDSAIEAAFGKAPLYLREGGSIPVIADFKRRRD